MTRELLIASNAATLCNKEDTLNKHRGDTPSSLKEDMLHNSHREDMPHSSHREDMPHRDMVQLSSPVRQSLVQACSNRCHAQP